MSRELTRPLPRTWWLRRVPYFRFMMRELTSLAVLAYTGLAVWALWAVGDRSAFSVFYEFLESPLSVWLHGVALALGLYHTGTWIALTPKVMVVWRDEEQVDPNFIAGLNGILFLIVTGGVLWLALT